MLDGKVAGKKQCVDCPKCGRKIMKRHSVCLYCGEVVSTHPFDR